MQKIIGLLALVNVSIWIAVLTVDNNLKIVACDVGQGDAILIQKNNKQFLIDGGPNNNVLNCLGEHMPFWDREIEVVFLTHPDSDHYKGLTDVFRNYNVKNFITNGGKNSSQDFKLLESEVGSSSTNVVMGEVGQSVVYRMIHLDILNPLAINSEDSGVVEDEGKNDQSLVLLLNYGKFKAIFTGDVEKEVSDRIAELHKVKDLEYIKVNHHGSRNGMTEKLLKQVNPKVAVISSGLKNRYGHPHAEIVEMLKKYGVKILRTDELGDVVVKTNGEKLW